MFVGNALVTKAKTIYGQSLRTADYEQLIKKKTVPEIVGYLKNHPGYQEILGAFQENSLHRAQLEELIRKNSFNRVHKVVKFVKMKDEKFYEINIVHREHEVILSMIRSFISQDEQAVIATLPLFFDKYTKINLEKIVKATDIRSLIESLQDTTYAQLLKPYEKVTNEEIKYTEIESHFENEYYRYVRSQIEKNYSKKLQTELLDIFETRIEISNIIKIYRLKKFYQASDSLIRQVLTPTFTRISQKKIDEIIAIKNPNDILKYIANTELAQFIGGKDQVYLEYYADHIKYDLARKNIYYSTKPQIVFLGFMVLMEIEVENLTHLIEGIRYSVDEREIRQILVY